MLQSSSSFRIEQNLKFSRSTRIEVCRKDMDDDSNRLIVDYGYCSQVRSDGGKTVIGMMMIDANVTLFKFCT